YARIHFLLHVKNSYRMLANSKWRICFVRPAKLSSCRPTLCKKPIRRVGGFICASAFMRGGRLFPVKRKCHEKFSPSFPASHSSVHNFSSGVDSIPAVQQSRIDAFVRQSPVGW